MSRITGWSGLLIIGTALLLALLAYAIAPDKSPAANTQILEIRTQKPGFHCSFLKVGLRNPPPTPSLAQALLNGRPDPFILEPMDHYRLSRDSIHLYRPVLYPGEPPREKSFALWEVLPGGEGSTQSGPGTSRPNGYRPETREAIRTLVVTKSFPLGTDLFGRDLLSRILIGLRISLAVGFISVLISLLLGISLGGVAGYFGGMTDKIITWLINVVWSIPTLLMVIAITLAIGRGFWQVFVAVGLSMWVEVARMVRGQVLGLREKEFIEAAKALGFSHMRIMLRHILPNVINPVIVISAANFASAILMEAGLSFLGIGVQPPTPSLGSMIKDHYGFIIVNKAYLAVIPGLVLMALVLAFTLVGDWLRDWLDVRSKNSPT